MVENGQRIETWERLKFDRCTRTKWLVTLPPWLVSVDPEYAHCTEYFDFVIEPTCTIS
jgi:hypothetical protein